MQEAPELQSAADPASEAWRANEAAHRALVEELRGKLAAARLGGGEKGRARHTASGKLLPGDRVDTPRGPGSTACSPPARTSWSWRRWPPTGSTTGRPRPPASSPGSGGSAGASA